MIYTRVPVRCVVTSKAYSMRYVIQCVFKIIIMATVVYMLVQIIGKQNDLSKQQTYNDFTTNTIATTVPTSPTSTATVSSTSTTAMTLTKTTYTPAAIAAAIASLVRSPCFYMVRIYLNFMLCIVAS